MEAALLVRLAVELLTAGSQAADGAGVQLLASRSENQIPIISCFTLGRVDPRLRWRRRCGVRPSHSTWSHDHVPPEDIPYDERQASFIDPGGNTWWGRLKADAI